MVKRETGYTDLDKLRHSCSHVLAQAVKRLYPEAQLAIGPPVKGGFYYDIRLERSLTDEDLAKIEDEMRSIIKDDYRFEKKVVSRDEARSIFAKKSEKYKIAIIDQIGSDEQISIVADGDFTDLCKYPHADSTGQIKAFKLTGVAGAYWRGDERNDVLQRVYGTAFFTQKDLGAYLEAREEAKKRDHRKLGVELDFFSLQEQAGQGLIFYHPKGALLRYLIEQYIREEHLRRGYSFVAGPQILKSDIWKISGHYSYYKDNMFIFQTKDEKEYAIKPMNCPGHMLIYKTSTRSYRDLPLRFFEMGNVCRNEKSGVLHGLLRVRNFTQDDAHIFCLPEQLEDEITQVLDFTFEVLKKFGFKEYAIDLSTRPRESIGSDTMWEKGTEALKRSLEKKSLDFSVCAEGGAFYGPKIDVQIKDALGRTWQCGTIQCDFALPEAFDLEYVSSSGKKARPVMVHRAILGSVERFMGCLLEHYAGALPLWLSPVQAVLMPIAKKHENYCADLADRLQRAEIRTAFFESTDTLNRRIRKAQEEKVPYILVAGDKEVDAQSIAVRRRGSKEQIVLKTKDFVAQCAEAVKKRAAEL